MKLNVDEADETSAGRFPVAGIPDIAAVFKNGTSGSVEQNSWDQWAEEAIINQVLWSGTSPGQNLKSNCWGGRPRSGSEAAPIFRWPPWVFTLPLAGKSPDIILFATQLSVPIFLRRRRVHHLRGGSQARDKPGIPLFSPQGAVRPQHDPPGANLPVGCIGPGFGASLQRFGPHPPMRTVASQNSIFV